MRIITTCIAILFSAIFSILTAHAGELAPRDGWVVTKTPHAYAELYPRLKAAIKANKMGHITTASATLGAKGRGLTIPGNRVVGVYNNVWAVRMLEASVAAGMEAPIRFYLTENTDGTSTLSYKTPSHVFAPYFADAKPDLKVMARELDAVFRAIHDDTVAQ
ncbi:MAG: DUF302 domain-containing protein [Hyphomicrobiales bacterium]